MIAREFCFAKLNKEKSTELKFNVIAPIFIVFDSYNSPSTITYPLKYKRWNNNVF
ncbi:MAG: hypothetical protein ACE5KT_02760 [Methanosarcinales archaeon]